MLPSRRHLPALSGLLALEAVERLGTTTAAARELNLTPGAISRALQEVEAQLGVPLLIRDRQRLRPTAAARDYVAQARRALDLLGQASLRLRTGGGGAVLSLAILPAFGMHWLAPRLRAFRQRNPDVTLTLSTRLRPFDLRAEGVDAAIHYGRADWPEAEHLLLMEEEVQAVAAPDLAIERVTGPGDLLSLPLLQIESRKGDWGRWFAAHGLPGQRPAGMVFDQFATMQQAAIHGLGVALLPRFLIEEDLATGRLVPVWGGAVRAAGSYWLVWPQTGAESPALSAFRDWIAAEAAGSRAA
ncbi:LysR family transcriptional regulator [Tabrizicola sp. TH137]|uniref:LysR family transcriptional regulator n=1 Tax=Tabrizicola sp. TH137 TaxID=2067452 RepID=UPI000C7B2530|nr:LysR family transcriptional regulator [Tabrizicola sp. TH137]PLL12973.1 LysR family transcriptional regulator [Tabrizicola sp. TH137]